MYKLCIFGGRDYDDHTDLLMMEQHIRPYVDKYGAENIEIISGRAKGADQLGEIVAVRLGTKLKYFPADWDKHGKAAGPIRNKEMAEYCDSAIGFWDGRSKGTKNMINQLESLNKPYEVVEYSK